MNTTAQYLAEDNQEHPKSQNPSSMLHFALFAHRVSPGYCQRLAGAGAALYKIYKIVGLGPGK